jgi:hypothetical protein
MDVDRRDVADAVEESELNGEVGRGLTPRRTMRADASPVGLSNILFDSLESSWRGLLIVLNKYLSV